MDLSIETGSIAKLFLENNNVKAFYDEVPKDFERPCIYFPTITVSSKTDSMTTYKDSYSWYIKMFDGKTSISYNKSIEIAEIIKKNRYKIKLYNSDGTEYGKNLTIRTIEVSKFDEGVCQVYITWYSSYKYNVEVQEKIINFFVDYNIKQEV